MWALAGKWVSQHSSKQDAHSAHSASLQQALHSPKYRLSSFVAGFSRERPAARGTSVHID